jgi:FtsH-binding integral membrane protein
LPDESFAVKRALYVLTDLGCLVVFVAIGRSSHHDGLRVGGMVSTLWPFVVGLAVAWVLLQRRRRRGDAPRDAALVVVVTVALGMILRVVAGQGTALAFIAVALAFLTLMMGGWRIVASFARRRRSFRRR